MIFISEIRKNPITGDLVIFATERNNRPYDFIKKNELKYDSDKNCPFCPGNERETPKEVYKDDENNWSIRVFQNKYPILQEFDRKIFDYDFYECFCGYGIHEVVVDTPKHIQKLYEYSDEHIINVIKSLKERFNSIYNKDNINYVQIFRNYGYNAGMSLIHSHWQILGMSIYGKIQRDMIYNIREYLNKNNNCIICDIIFNERNQKIRIISENENFISFVPYAAKFSYEIYIVPKKHISTFNDFDNYHIRDFALILKDMMKRVYKINDNISYNICFMDSPKCLEQKHFHWYANIVPRIGNLAGFELSTGAFINPVMPEFSAEFYRKFN